MPAQRPRAAFEPIRPDFDLKALVEKTPNFHYVDRISCDMIEVQGHAAFEKLVLLHVIIGGKPLVIDGYEKSLDPWTFSRKWLLDNCGEKVENARVLSAQGDMPLTMGHYLKNMGKLTNQFFDKPGAYREKERQRVYLKDIDCPPVWVDKLKEYIPSSLFYLNESTGEVGGPGTALDPSMTGARTSKGIARAGDLMSSLPPDMRAENLMCYVGHEGTYTPAHREMCASLGQNIMVDASNNISDEGQAEKPGSSIWFMTESKERFVVSEYWLSVLGHDIEVETHFAQVAAWKRAPFSVYVVEQRPGDLILIPPLAPHQVWNRGTCTIKVAWNRTTVETLDMALNEALPRSRIVCRDEQYKNKAIVYYTLQKYSSLLNLAKQQAMQMTPQDAKNFLYNGKVKQLIKDFRRLFNLYKQVLLSEVFGADDRDNPKGMEYIPFDSNVTCAYCRGNIFNRFLTCPSCKDVLGHHVENGEGDPYDVCMECYAMGRSCGCISSLKWVEQFRWKELASKYETWRNLIIVLDGGQVTDKTPLSIAEERRRYGKKTLAEICKEQLKRRPWKDIRKQPEDLLEKEDEDDEEIVVGDDGTVKAIRKKPNKTWLKNSRSCHVCCHRHPNWKMAACTTCERAFCYGSLFRGWDKMPTDIMEDNDWSCPHCLGICFAGACRKDPKMTPYEPKGTLLGHDTKRVADARSVEALVDFSVSNLTWLRDDDNANRTESSRVKRARAEADAAIGQEPMLEEEDDDHEGGETQIEIEDGSQSPVLDHTFIDPALTGEQRAHDEDAAMLRRLQEARLDRDDAEDGMEQPHGNSEFQGYTAINAAGYAPVADMGGYSTSMEPYTYPGYLRHTSVEPMNRESEDLGGMRPFKRPAAHVDEDQDISMQKHPKTKKPKLAAAGFRSTDLADGVIASKAKNDLQRQFEKEKERKAIEKAKLQGRFIILQAKLRGKKRIVKLNLSAHHLRSFQQRTLEASHIDSHEHSTLDATLSPRARTASGIDEMSTPLLKSDVAPRVVPSMKPAAKPRESEPAKKPKKVVIPSEKDDTYNARSRGRGTGVKGTVSGERRRSRRPTVHYEEPEIESDDNFESDEPDARLPAKKRQSLPASLNSRKEWESEQADHVRTPASERIKKTTNGDISHDSFRKPAAKRPSIRPSGMMPAIDLDTCDDELESVLDAAVNGEFERSQKAARSGGGGHRHSQSLKEPMSTSQTRIDEENRQAKLQALQAMDLIDP